MNSINLSLDETKQNLINTVRVLSRDIGTRSYLELHKLERSINYIEDQLRTYGCNSERQSFEVNGINYHNIYSKVQGTGPSDEILAIGAHYDTVPGTPGADDNASGVAGMLELARLFKNNPAPYTVYLVAFTLEEPPFFGSSRMGSNKFAESLHKKNIKVKGMISLEMIGYFNDKKGSQYYPLPMFRFFYPKVGNYIAFVGNLKSKPFTDTFKKIFKQVSSLDCESLNTVSIVPGVDFSDHRSFWHFNYPAFMITDTAFYRNPNYHGAGDTADTLNYEKMTELVLGIYKTIEQM